MREGFEEGDFVLVDPNLLRQYISLYEWKNLDDGLLEAVIKERNEPNRGSKSYNYQIYHKDLGHIPCLDDCFIMACQHCREKMIHHDKFEKWFCPSCEDIGYLSKKRRMKIAHGHSD